MKQFNVWFRRASCVSIRSFRGNGFLQEKGVLLCNDRIYHIPGWLSRRRLRQKPFRHRLPITPGKFQGIIQFLYKSFIYGCMARGPELRKTRYKLTIRERFQFLYYQSFQGIITLHTSLTDFNWQRIAPFK